MYASTNVNYRSLPSTDGEILGSLKINEKVTVTGYVTEYKGEECLWTEIGEGQFVNAKYLSEKQVEVK
ncbi:MAG: hypothetical protein K5894_01835, partial [Lachnospiraceae bacterium]|nr:hypothetical protein [Lachnospiraceae bacterium]